VKLSTVVLHAVVFIAGAAVLAIEILGTRVLGPFYGADLFLWSALITVTLVALAAGYWLGGRWADRGARLSGLAWPLAAAGLWLIAVPWLRRPLLAAPSALGLRAAVLVAAFALFAPPLALLGMVSPYAIRLRAASLSEVGRAAGDLWALSTLAGVLSALATGFWLVPHVGVSRLLRGVGAALLLGAAAAWEADRGPRWGVPALLAVGIAGLGIASGAIHDGRAPRILADGRELVAVRDSPYAELRVVDAPEGRFLLVDGGVHSLADPENWRSRVAYVQAIDVVKNFFAKPGRLLLIGLGGGSVAKSFAADGWKVDAVEIDPVVVEVARRYFGLGGGDAQVFVADGRGFLCDAGVYDAVVIDAFGSSSIPFHLITAEAFGLVARHLRPRGVVALNVEAIGWRDPMVSATAAALRHAFSQVLAFPTAEPPHALGNVILLGSDAPLAFDEDKLGRPFEYLADADRHWAVVQRNHAWNNRFDPDRTARAFSDDLNGVDVMAARINRAARKALREYPPLRDLSW
jgi:spermidine synthase